MITTQFRFADSTTTNGSGWLSVAPVLSPNTYSGSIIDGDFIRATGSQVVNGQVTMSLVPADYLVKFISNNNTLTPFTMSLPVNIDGQTVNAKDYIVPVSIPTTNLTASYAINSTFAQTASYALNISPADSASYASFADSSSNAQTASYVTASNVQGTVLIATTASVALSMPDITDLKIPHFVGINNTSPKMRLDVNGQTNISNQLYLGYTASLQSTTYNGIVTTVGTNTNTYGPAGCTPSFTITDLSSGQPLIVLGNDNVNAGGTPANNWAGEIVITGKPALTASNPNNTALIGGLHFVDQNNNAGDNRSFIIRSKRPNSGSVNSDYGAILCFENRYLPFSADQDTTFANFLGVNELGNTFIGDGGQLADRNGLYPNAKVSIVGSPWKSFPIFSVYPDYNNLQNSQSYFIVDSTGSVGVGTYTPAYTFDVNGNIGQGTTGDFLISSGGNNSYLNAHGGNVGIGRNNPGYNLDVSSDINTYGIYRQNGLPYTASLAKTASFAYTSSYALTASFVTASNVQGVVNSASFAVTSSYLNGNAAASTITSNNITAYSSFILSSSLADKAYYTMDTFIDPINAGQTAMRLYPSATSHDLYFGLSGQKFYNVDMSNISNNLIIPALQFTPGNGANWYITSPSSTQLKIGTSSDSFWIANYNPSAGVASNQFKTIGGGTAGTTLLALGIAGQTGPLQDWQNVSGSVMARIDISGSLTCSNILSNGYPMPTIQAGSSSVSAATTKIVTFSKSMPNTSYVVQLEPENAGITQSYVTGKTLNGFTASFGPTFTGVIDWTATSATQ